MNLACERLIVSGLLTAACWLAIPAASGQTGRLEGRILDATGGGVPATITLLADDRVRTTTADWEGNFVFIGLIAPVRYLEASAKGFVSSSIPITDAVPQPISVTLQVGYCTSCPVLARVDGMDHSVYYEERSGREQLTGTVSEFSGPGLPGTSLELMKADLDTTERSWPGGRSPAMDGRCFQYTFVAEVASNERGEFQFAGLEPGWYLLEAFHVGYNYRTEKFWIARETLTRPSRIEMARTGSGGSGQPSPLPCVGEIPLTPAPLPDIPLIPASQ